MSHGVTQIDAIAYRADGDLPWHGVNCNAVDVGADLESWIAAANMNFDVLKRRVRYAGANVDDMHEYPGQIAMVRSDTFAPLGIGSDKFQIVQPRAIAEFFRDMSGDLTTMGTLHGGKRFFAMVTIGEDVTVIDPRDKMRPSLLAATAVDGSMATNYLWTAIRVVCNNTLQWALQDGAKESVRVTHRSKVDERSVKRQLGFDLAATPFESAMANMRKLAQTDMSETAMLAMTALLFHPDFEKYEQDKRDKVLRSKQVEAVARLAIDKQATGADLDGAGGTAYGWLNSVTEYVDHAEKRAGQTVDNRITSAYFGPGMATKSNALEMALNYAPGSLEDVIAATNKVFVDRREAASTGSNLLDAVLESTII